MGKTRVQKETREQHEPAEKEREATSTSRSRSSILMVINHRVPAHLQSYLMNSIS